MEQCPRCGYCPNACEVPGCDVPAKYEGWVRVKDFAGIPTGLIQRRQVCEEHTLLTIAKGG